MADLVKISTIDDNVNEVVMTFSYQYVDTGNEASVVKVTPANLAKSSNGTTCTALRIVEAWWVIAGMTVEIEAGVASGPKPILLNLTDVNGSYQDYSLFGGLPSTISSGGTGPTGVIKFTTTGAGAVSDSYQIALRMKKVY